MGTRPQKQDGFNDAVALVIIGFLAAAYTRSTVGLAVMVPLLILVVVLMIEREK